MHAGVVMSGKDSLPLGAFGFARRSSSPSELGMVAPRLIENQNRQAVPALPKIAADSVLQQAAVADQPRRPEEVSPEKSQSPEKSHSSDQDGKQQQAALKTTSVTTSRLGPRTPHRIQIPELARMPSDDAHWVVRSKVQSSEDAVPSMQQPTLRRRRGRLSVGSTVVEDKPLADMRAYQAPRRWIALGLSGMIYAVGIAGLVSMVMALQDTMNAASQTASSELALPPIDDMVDMFEFHRDGPFIPRFKPSDDVAALALQRPS